MKPSNVLRLCLLLAFCFTQTECSPHQKPTKEEIGSKVQQLWDANRIEELRKYLAAVESEYPKYVPAIAAASFYRFIFTGDMRLALQKLELIQADVKVRPEFYSDEFKDNLKGQIRDINQEIEAWTEAGLKESQWHSNAAPQKIHDAWSQQLPGFLMPTVRMIKLAPKVDL